MSVAEFMVLRARVTALEAVVAALQARLDAQDKEAIAAEAFHVVMTDVSNQVMQKRGPGRPRKVDSE